MTKHSHLLYFLVAILFALGIFLRFWKIDQIPSGFSWDEASIGYNGWSILESGKDEWGQSFPLHFRAFGEWKLPIYIYSTIPFIKVFGLNELSVRLPSILSGIMAAVVFGLIWCKIRGRVAGAVAAILYLFSFWSFSLSRGAFEANLGILIFLVAVYLLIKKRLILSAILFVSLLYTYNAFRILLPLYIPLVIYLYKEKISKKKLILAILIFLFGTFPLARFLLMNDTSLSRFSQVVPQNHAILGTIQNYFSHFSPSFLIFKGDGTLRHFPGETGQFSFLVIVLGVIGLFNILRKISCHEKINLLVIVLLFLAPVPAAITKDSPHSIRAIMLLPAWLSLAVIGADQLKKVIRKRYVMAAFILLFSMQYFYFYSNYFSNYAKKSVDYWQSGYRELFTKLSNIESKNPFFVTSDKLQPYIFYLFYYQKLVDVHNADIAQPYHWHESRLVRIGNYYFLNNKDLRFRIGNGDRGVFVVNSKNKEYIPPNLDYQTIYNRFGEPEFYIFIES